MTGAAASVAVALSTGAPWHLTAVFIFGALTMPLYAMALAGSLLLGDKLSGGAAYVTKTLSGSMLWVSWPIVGITAAVCVVLLILQ